MTRGTELLPLPLTTGYEPDCAYPEWVNTLLTDYARANVTAALASAHEDLQARAERAEASAERWRSRYIAEVVCYRVDQNGDSESKALAAAHAAAEKLDHLDKARAALSTNAATQTGERT